MTYREQQRMKTAMIRKTIMKDPGQGLFNGKPRDFVLREPSFNLWEGIQEDAKAYFKKYKIKWWKGDGDDPTGHLLSSQVACINHLYFLRQRPDVATALLKGLDASIDRAAIVDNGYVEFEFIGAKRYLKEKSWTRGANCTSVDAAMIGQREDGTRVMFLIEWKYTEDYRFENKYIPERSRVYDELITSLGSPFKTVDVKAFYYEPFYQMMRQTLLAQQIVDNNDHECTDYYHVHVIPKENIELLKTITSPALSGKDISVAWRAVLKNPNKYLCRTPLEFLRSANGCPDCSSIFAYLQKRYWS